MVRIVFVEETGVEKSVDGASGETLMRLAVNNLIDGIEGECGGEMTCGTCHVKPRPGHDIPPPSFDEDEMLEVVNDRDERSRLGCQIEVTELLDGLVVDVPSP